eukprot:5980121-Amphidinium_carterae.2
MSFETCSRELSLPFTTDREVAGATPTLLGAGEPKGRQSASELPTSPLEWFSFLCFRDGMLDLVGSRLVWKEQVASRQGQELPCSPQMESVLWPSPRQFCACTLQSPGLAHLGNLEIAERLAAI